MRNKLIAAALVTVLLAAVLTAAALAEVSPVQLVVNGRVIETDVPPQLVNGRTIAPVRQVVEALGAEVKWDERTRQVWIYSPELDSLQRQITLLQKALAPATPRDAVGKWAKGLKERNGALQFAVLAPELQEQSHSDLESRGWVTGVSSPWVERFEIIKETQAGSAREYEVRFYWATSTGPAGDSTTKVTVRQYGENWYVSQIQNDGFIAEQLKMQAREYLTQKYRQHYRIDRIEITPLAMNIAGSRAEAEFKTTVWHAIACATPAEWPPQKGRIKYLEENRQNLTPEQIRKIEERIDFWNKELQGYIDKPIEVNEFLKFTADLDGMGVIKKDTVEIFYEDPIGKYLPVKKEDWPAFKTAEELEKLGYEEMRELVGR
ncbi:hypothetical membrane protein [Pelotomaculum thermopropionicum SI]|uniref:Hypothetical membrane protein n=1 Tax=Pelotomaculum thermopropionicum (strain DSM 13744 / JCM 10971 / SI) TaxID=370438 RepID=A5D5M4_PELTS|nr:hypothetical membrane protein [Pelotomaculum thermopropionicum SI]